MRAKLPASSTGTCERRAADRSGLAVADREQRAVRDRLDVAGAERVGRDAERADVVLERDALDDVRVRGAGLDQRAAERLEEHLAVHAPGAVLRDLARAAGHDVLVAFAAALRVVGRAEPVRDQLDFLEDEAVVVERAPRHDRVFIEGFVGRPLRRESVGPVVEAGQRLGDAGKK